jgi:hypothetical protein
MPRPPSDLEPSRHRFRILAIDGGGIRGIVPAEWLTALEAELRDALRDAPAEQQALWRRRGIDAPRIADCFHLIAGTSTGGLLAAGLTVPDSSGRPRLTAEEAGTVYARHGREIFRRPPLRRFLDPLGLLRPRYERAGLADVLARADLLDERLLSDALTEVLITAYDIHRRRHRNFTRWGPSASTPMREIALGTAAAPTYFPPEEVDDLRLVDGGVFAANPALAALALALRRTEDPAPLTPDDLLLVSLGTGTWERPLDIGGGGILGWLRPQKGGEPLLEAILDGQSDLSTEAGEMVLNGWRDGVRWDPTLPPESLGGGPRFWRYQVELPEPWPLDDVNRIPDLQRVGAQLVDTYRAEVRRLAQTFVAAGPVPRPRT